MGSYDKQPEDWNDFADMAWMPPHVIKCNSGWSHRDARHDHQAVWEVRACFEAAHAEKAGKPVWPCTWLIEGRYDDGSRFTYECGEPTTLNGEEGEYECAAGHSHVPAWVRADQGWDYAEDDEEAKRLRSVGIDAVSMRGDSI